MKKNKQILKLVFYNLFGLFVSIFAQEPTEWENVPETIKRTNAFKRIEWFYRTRENESGAFPKEFIENQKAIELGKVKTIFQKGNKLQTTSDNWTNIGPKAIDMTSSFIPYWGNVSGRVRGVAVHPTDANTVYIGAAAGGIWKTVNGGTSWSDMSGDLNQLTFGAIAIDPNNPNTVYAGTGESAGGANNTFFEGDGLYKTTDGGISWTRITNGFGSHTQFGDIEVSPHNSNIILAALGSSVWSIGNQANEGVWRSSDAGVTWTHVNLNSDAFDVAFDPTAASTIAYAAAVNTSNASGGFFVSNDAGATWAQSNTGLPSPTAMSRMQFSIANSSPSTIYAIVYPGTASFDVYKSTNFGASWSHLTPVAGAANQGWYDLAIAVNPTDANNVFFGNAEMCKTTDGSTLSMVRISPTGGNGDYWDCPIHTDIHKIVYAPSNSSIMYAGCDGGIYKSINGGLNWTHINNNINTLQFYSVASDKNNANILYGGAQDNGNFSTVDKGATDWVFETSGDGMENFVDYNNSSNVFMSTQNGSLYLSNDGGLTWDNIFGGGGNTAWVDPFWQHPTNPNRIFAAWNRYIIRSDAPYTSWSYHSSGQLTTTNRITSVAHSTINANNLMAVASYYTVDAFVYKSIDVGVSWTDISGNLTTSGFTATTIQKAVADPVNGNTFYLCRVSYDVGQVLKTTDFGATWTDISGNLPKIAHNDLFVDPANTNHLYVANDFGVYWSKDGGTEWNKLSNGMPFVPVLNFDFYVNGATRLLRAASHGRGVFELQIDTPLDLVYVDLKVFLEGSYNSNNMNTNINGNIPTAQPYNVAPWNYLGTETASINSNPDIVDWVLVELRTGASPATATTIVATKAGLLKSDGTIVDSDGFTNINFNVAAGSYYIVIYHRNHLPIMSPTSISIN
ncbi:MAG: hypothetical protein WAR79_03015 [Melioribacteraceae bacterium]